MRRLFAVLVAVLLAVACILETTPSFARKAGHGGARIIRDPTVVLGAGTSQVPAYRNRIPAPLPPPAQAPIVNGPISQPAFRGLSGIGQ
jgi:hypothetical protein